MSLKLLKKSLLILTCCVLMTGCGFAGNTYQEYVTAILDCTYHDEQQAYIALTNVSVPEAEIIYDEEAEALSQRIQNYFGVKSDMITEDMKEKYLELAGNVLRRTSYSVRDVIKSETGYEITLMISPLDFWNQAEPDVKAYYENDFSQRYARTPTQKAADRMEEVYAFQVYKILTEHAENMAYASPAAYTFTLESGQNTISSVVWTEIDKLILNFP